MSAWVHHQWLSACEWLDSPRGSGPALAIVTLLAVVLVAVERRAGGRARP